MIRRRTYTDILTLMALMAVSISNISTSIWNSIDKINTEWNLFGSITVLTQWGLPLLIAVFGISYLYRDMNFSIQRTYSRILPQTMIACIFWWIVAALILLKTNYNNELDMDTFLECMGNVLEAPYNVGFLQMIVVLFAFYPLLYRIVKNDKLLNYAVIVFFVVSTVLPILENIPYVRYLNLFTNQINWGFFTSYGLYLFLGVWAIKKDFRWHYRIVIYCLGILSTVAMFSLTKIASISTIGVDSRFANDTSPFVAFQVLAIITFIKKICAKEFKNRRIVLLVSELAKNKYGFIAMYMVVYGLISDYISEKFPLIFGVISFAILHIIITLLRKILITAYLLCDIDSER